jgi:hypothetical protein
MNVISVMLAKSSMMAAITPIFLDPSRIHAANIMETITTRLSQMVAVTLFEKCIINAAPATAPDREIAAITAIENTDGDERCTIVSKVRLTPAEITDIISSGRIIL